LSRGGWRAQHAWDFNPTSTFPVLPPRIGQLRFHSHQLWFCVEIQIGAHLDCFGWSNSGLAIWMPGARQCRRSPNFAVASVASAGMTNLGQLARYLGDKGGRFHPYHLTFSPGRRDLLRLYSPFLAIKSSTTSGSANVDVSPIVSISSVAILRRIRRMILPERVLGRAGAQ
jgi:hypothetical protein